MNVRWKDLLLGVAILALGARPGHAGVTMSDLWPSDDGRSWKYEIHQEVFENPPVGATGQIRLLFDGPTVAPTGIASQYLRQEQLASQAPVFASLMEVEAMAVRDPFLRWVYVARPDLRARILELNGGVACPDNVPNGMHAILLGGEFAYRKTGSEVAAWRCNLADTRSWQWLTSNLSIGSNFLLQLVPDLASNVYLTGEVVAIEDVTVPAGTFNGCFRVHYVVDYGEQVCDDGYGNTGTAHMVTQGFVDYAPFQGPVRSQEDYIPWTQVTGTCAPPEDVDRVFQTITLELLSPSVPTLPMTWGAVKAIYR